MCAAPIRPSGMTDWHLYIVRVDDGSLYTGISTDVERRVREHRGGGRRAANYFRGRMPEAVVFTSCIGDRARATRAEYAIKRLNRTQKEQLIGGTLSLADVLDDVSGTRRRRGDS
jgi:putative endonuclease